MTRSGASSTFNVGVELTLQKHQQGQLDYRPLLLRAMPMIDITVVLTAKDSARLPEICTLLAEHIQLSRAEPGCLRFEAYESTSVPGTIILIERWESSEALDEHRRAPGFMTIYAPKVLPLVDRVPHICSVLAGT